MPIIERHAPGTFNWFELATTDQAAAKEFYSQLFGWTWEDSPMGPDAFYTTFKLDGADAAAAYTLLPDMRAQGIPAHWDIYVAVESADQAAAKIESFGGVVIVKPLDVLTYGRMAVASDPTGAAFCVWQKYTHMGAAISAPTGTVCWADLNTSDPDAASRFYSGVFGWELYQGQNDPSGYLHIKCGDVPIGGIYPAKLPPNTPPHWMLYFSAADIDLTTNKAGALGATTLVAVQEIPNTGKFSIVQDPQGAAFALFQPAAKI
jgi:predicted enzyme related to lactoylglutathione lyase